MDTKQFIAAQWDNSVVPVLTEYIKVPNQSPDFDPEWKTNGLIEKAMGILVDWAKVQDVKGMTMELLQDPEKTPFLYINIDPFDGQAPAPKADPDQPTILMYGHMDKQPPLLPWAEGLGPYTPVMRDGRLYGRGGADDGYAICASLLSVIAVQRQGKPHTRICVIIEASEESDETHLDYYIEKLKARFGRVSLVVCLDSGAMTYDRLWLTSSLRGVMSVSLKVELLAEGMHSGLGGGAVADTFRVQRLLLDRIEDSATGKVLVPEAWCDIPAGAIANMQALNELPRADFMTQWPLLPGVVPQEATNLDLALNVFWRPSLTVIGADGLPELSKAGNVLRQQTTLRLSLRLPPLVKGHKVKEALEAKLSADPPFNAKVTAVVDDSFDGWAAPELEPWLNTALNEASQDFFGKPFAAVGLGGSIPFMGMLGDMFPAAQFVVTGVLGPQSNAHGPNEFLDIQFGKGVNTCVAHVLSAHYDHHFPKQ